MPSGIIGKAVAHSVCDLITKGESAHLHEASMADMGAACVASAGKGLFDGTAAAMTVYPVVPDFEKYPGTGRDTEYTFGSMVPGKTAKKLRTCVIWQFIRFIALNIKMIIVVRKSH